MSEAKPTPGPLRIQADDKWPFYIRTIDAAGDCVFREDMPAYSTNQKSLAECLAGKHMKDMSEVAVRANAVALANAELRAEAHNVLTTTGLTPRQLVERVKELEEVLSAARNELYSLINTHNKQDEHDGSWLYDWQTVVEIDAALSKGRPNTAEGEVQIASQPAPVLDYPHARRFGGCPSCGRSDCVAMSCTRGNSDELLCIETIKKP